MAASTTIQDLPDDMLHEIFEHVLTADLEKSDRGIPPAYYVTRSPKGAHLALRCVCRRWRDIADWVRLSTSTIVVDTARLTDAGAVRARHPAAFKRLSLGCPPGGHTTSVSLAAASLINGSADMRRALSYLELQTCCLSSLLRAVTPIASCTALTELALLWNAHKKKRVVPFNVLAPLSALRLLHTLSFKHNAGSRTASALLAPLPALPDAPRLTAFALIMSGSFVPVGSDAASGRLRCLVLEHMAPVQELVDAEDPFLLRTAFDAGTWQPSRLTGLQLLQLKLGPVRGDLPAPARPSQTGSRAGSEWAPLARQVSKLYVLVESDGYNRPSTGIVAGLGVLTALRELHVFAETGNQRPGRLEAVFLDRVHAPYLTQLASDCASTPANVAQFPKLVHLFLSSMSRQPPLNLRSLVARSSLKILQLYIPVSSPGSINLAELFVGGGGWPVLEHLTLDNIVLEWDTTSLAGAPTADEFGDRARRLLPALVDVEIDEPKGRDALPDPSRAEFVAACDRHVVPALKGLHAGGG